MNCEQRAARQENDRGEEHMPDLKDSKFSVDPSNLVWIFGTARVGSTWLMRMMGELHTTWNEPLVGDLFGSFHDQISYHQRRGDEFILGGRYKETALRRFVLWSVSERFPEAERVIIKEPNGSLGAPYISTALPESGLICLIRDPRDVVASNLGAARLRGWHTGPRRRRGLPPEEPGKAVRSRAKRYMKLMGASTKAYESHEGPKALVRYEELRTNTREEMSGLYKALGIPVDREKLLEAIEKHDWDNIPDEQKGPGKSMRKAKPGGWREDLTEEQVTVVERITAPLMDKLGYDRA